MIDRERALASVDLRELADELLGPRRGTTASASWPCPDAGHAQTGRTPPVSVFLSRRGEQRWRCHGCGAGGTAIDLVVAATGCGVGEALELLSARTGAGARAQRRGHDAPRVTQPGQLEGLHRYVSECAARLWTREGTAVRTWLMRDRGLPEPVLRTNLVGADAGPRRQRRPDGVPRVGRAAVLPALVDGRAIYAQLRRIQPRPDQPQYLNVASRLAVNPKVVRYLPGAHRRDEIIVTEGPIDALSVTAAGFRSVAVLGAHSADGGAALLLASIDAPLVLAFDADDAGASGADRVARMLRDLGRTATTLTLPGGVNDLNDWLNRDRHVWGQELASAVDAARARSHGRSIA